MYLSRLNTSFSHMLLDGLDGHLLPVKDTRGQGRLHIGFFKDLTKVFNLPGTGLSDYRDGDVFTNMFYKFNVKATIGTIFVYAVE